MTCRLKAKRVSRPCANCGATITRLASQVKAGLFFCNRQCKGEHMSRRIPWNKGLSQYTSEALQRVSTSKLGDLNPMRRPAVRVKSSISHIGKRDSPGTRRAKSMAQKRVIAEGRHNFYIDGRSSSDSARVKAYHTVEYKIWRSSVFERDRYKCQKCGKGGYLEAHHIKSWATNPELRYDTSNGITLCRECHAKEDPSRMRTLPREIRKQLQAIP